MADSDCVQRFKGFPQKRQLAPPFRRWELPRHSGRGKLLGSTWFDMVRQELTNRELTNRELTTSPYARVQRFNPARAGQEFKGSMLRVQGFNELRVFGVLGYEFVFFQKVNDSMIFRH